MKSPTPATRARERSGLSPAQIARKLGYRSERHYRALERHGGMPEPIARRWAQLTGADAKLIHFSPAFLTALDAYQAAKSKGQLGDWPSGPTGAGNAGNGADTGNRAISRAEIGTLVKI